MEPITTRDKLIPKEQLRAYLAHLLGLDPLSITGEVDIVLRGPDGRIKERERIHNLVVTAGRAHCADQLADQGEAAMAYMAIGTGTTAPATTDTALETELDRNALDSKTQGTGTDANKVTYTCTWAAGDGTGAITEAGIFNSASAGTMLSRVTFDVKNKGAGDSLTLTWTLTFSA
jgi:hypothetical protein